jgi:hypothetical protein
MFCDFFDFLSLKNDIHVPVFRIRIHMIRMFFGLSDPLPDQLVRSEVPYGSEDPDPHPDPYQNVTDPEHWI